MWSEFHNWHLHCLRLLLLAAAAACASCRDKDDPVSQRAPAEPIRVGIQNNAVTGLVMLADARNDFTDCGLDVSIQRFPSGKLALQAMLDGELDLATCADMPFVAASLETGNIAVVATVAQTDRGAWIVARKDRGIRKPTDLEGKHVATQKLSAVHFFLSNYLMRHYISEDSVKLTFMQPNDMVEALVAGDIDAFCMRNPYTSRAAALLGDNAVELTDRNIYLQTFNLVSSQRFLQRHASQITCLLRALTEAETFAVAHPGKAARMTALAYGLDREGDIRADWQRYSYAVRLEQTLILTLESQAKWLLYQQGRIDVPIPNYLNYIYFDALETIRPQAVNILH